MTDTFQKIFVSHVAGLGQTILAVPALRALRHYFPHSHITIAAAYSAVDIIQLSHTANIILPISRKGEIINPRAGLRSLKTLNELRRNHYDLTLELARNASGGLARYLAQTGTDKKQLKLLTQIREAVLRRYHQDKHFAQLYLEILSEIGAFPIDAEPKLFTERSADALIENRLRKSGMLDGGLLIGLHPGAGRNKPRWSAENFMTIAEKLIHVMNARVLVFAGPYERGLAKLITKQLPPKKSLAFESLSLQEAASALARLSVFITNHSGPAHLAAALGTPVVAATTTAISLHKDLLSRNHIHIRKAALELITTDEMYEAATQLIKANRAEYLWAR